jgi:phosphotransferase system HPr (HPr) family protein
MNGNCFRHTVRVVSPNGFHMRPATAFAELARRYQASVTVSKDGQAVDGKGPLNLLLLGAEQGSELLIQADGPDADEAGRALVELFTTLSFDEPSDPPLPPKG